MLVLLSLDVADFDQESGVMTPRTPDLDADAECVSKHGFAVSIDADRGVLHLSGDLRMEHAADIWKQLLKHAATIANGQPKVALALKRKRSRATKKVVEIDLSHAQAIDGGVMSLLVALRADLADRSIASKITGTDERFRPLIDLYEADAIPKKVRRRKPEGFVEGVGRATASALGEAKAVISFFGEMVIAAWGLVRHPRSGHWKEVPPLMEKAGADAVPIVVLINLLLGFVMAYQSARQLKMYGANLYVADLVGISVTRELAPLMTAIIVCGRTGAAIAAEIGSMKVSDEVDALRTLGLRPFAWLVVPRVIALLIVVPFLTVIGDLVGILGGLIVAVTSLDVGIRGYFLETQNALKLWDIEHGLIKSVAFALAIGLIACQQGFSASGGAEGVGKRTTSTVVTCLFALVLLDALFTMTFRMMGR